MLELLWNKTRRILLIAGIMLSVVFLAELARLFLLFHRIHPVAGWAFAGFLAIGFLCLLVQFIRAWSRHPRVLVPPPLPPPGEATHAQMRRYSKYLVLYLSRLAENEALLPEAREAARGQAVEIGETLAHHPLNDDLARTIEETESRFIAPALAELEQKASQEVRHCVRDVMLGVTLSPYASMDILIVLYRNASMVLRVVQTYRNRPGIREQLLTLRDTFAVVATVSFFNVSRKLLENLFSQVPLVGRVVDDIGQGLGAGLLTSVAGHAAISRCAAFRGWNREEEARSLSGQMAVFLADIRDLFTKDLFGELKGRIRSSAPPGAADEPGFLDSICRGVGSAIDATAAAIDTLVVRPAAAGVEGVVTVGTHIARAGTKVIRASARHGRSARHGVSRVLRTFVQRIQYTIRGRNLHKEE